MTLPERKTQPPLQQYRLAAGRQALADLIGDHITFLRLAPRPPVSPPQYTTHPAQPAARWRPARLPSRGQLIITVYCIKSGPTPVLTSANSYCTFAESNGVCARFAMLRKHAASYMPTTTSSPMMAGTSPAPTITHQPHPRGCTARGLWHPSRAAHGHRRHCSIARHRALTSHPAAQNDRGSALHMSRPVRGPGLRHQRSCAGGHPDNSQIPSSGHPGTGDWLYRAQPSPLLLSILHQPELLEQPPEYALPTPGHPATYCKTAAAFSSRGWVPPAPWPRRPGGRAISRAGDQWHRAGALIYRGPPSKSKPCDG